MDLLEFDGQALYFDEAVATDVADLLDQASAQYSDGEGELPLLRAYLLAPQSLMVLVGLYRFYYYRHRLDLALEVAHRVLAVAGERLRFPDDWRRLSKPFLGGGVMKSMGMVRFYLLALKAAGYLNIRLSNDAEGRAMLEKVIEMDAEDRLGAGSLLSVVEELESPDDEQRASA